MAAYDLRPLSLGEILDRTFSLYRRHFLLFIGIAAVPQLALLAIGWAQTGVSGLEATHPGSVWWAWGVLVVVSIIASILAYLISQAGTVLAVSDVYLGRTASISASLRRALGEMVSLFGVVVLNGLACLAGLIALIIPGIYVGCRLLVCVPAALIEQRGPRDSLSRSFNLTRDYAGRAFVIWLLFFCLAAAAAFLVGMPAGIAAVFMQNDPALLMLASMLMQVLSSVAHILTQPFLLIATAVFYYDLRVRKEAFDLQFMMDPSSEGRGGSTSSIPSIIS
jgi:hypothetical protein